MYFIVKDNIVEKQLSLYHPCALLDLIGKEYLLRCGTDMTQKVKCKSREAVPEVTGLTPLVFK